MDANFGAIYTYINHSKWQENPRADCSQIVYKNDWDLYPKKFRPACWTWGNEKPKIKPAAFSSGENAQKLRLHYADVRIWDMVL